MIARLIPVSVFLVTLCLTISMSQAQTSEEPCSSREAVYPRVKTAILDEAGYKSARVRLTEVGERLDIIGSKRFGPWCWLQVSDGWLIDNTRSLSSEPLPPAVESGGGTGAICYRNPKIYVNGNMNIRSQPTTNSEVVAKARDGDIYDVTRSARGTIWCWLKIASGWMAKTDRVQATKAVQYVAYISPAPYAARQAVSQPATTTHTSNVDNCCFVDRQCQSEQDWKDGYYAYQNNQCPSSAQPVAIAQPADPWAPSHRVLNRPIIEGSEWFIYGIHRTLNLMQGNAPEWYNYVLNAADKIVESFNPATPRYPHANTTNWGNGASRTIGVGAGSLSCYRGSLCRVSVAGILAHEACHIHEYLEGIVYAPDDPHWHDLCQKAARDTAASIYAGSGRIVR